MSLRLITSTKQIKPSVLASLKGKAGSVGPAGANGANGAQGPQGPQGPAGNAGTNGTGGTEGTAGSNGTSVTSKEQKAGVIGPCKEGGSEFIAAEAKKTYACNGSPWTAGGTLPKEATETGTWSMTIPKKAAAYTEAVGLAPISFTIPLAGALEEEKIEIEPLGYAGSQAECPGTAADPKAEAGFLCVYIAYDPGSQVTPTLAGEGVPSTTGGVVLWDVLPEAKEGYFAYGSWAVTAE